MRLAGGGKSGGARVIYLYLAEQEVIFLATLYRKSKRETLTDDEKQSLKEAARRIKAHFKLGMMRSSIRPISSAMWETLPITTRARRS